MLVSFEVGGEIILPARLLNSPICHEPKNDDQSHSWTVPTSLHWIKSSFHLRDFPKSTLEQGNHRLRIRHSGDLLTSVHWELQWITALCSRGRLCYSCCFCCVCLFLHWTVGWWDSVSVCRCQVTFRWRTNTCPLEPSVGDPLWGITLRSGAFTCFGGVNTTSPEYYSQCSWARADSSADKPICGSSWMACSGGLF